MNARVVAVVAVVSSLFALPAIGATPKGSTSHATHTKSSGKHTSTKPRESTPSRAVTVPRDANGRIKRSESAKSAFMRQTGHPHGWSGHVVDHMVPLACGGADAPSNMQWQTIADARAKDKVERIGCGKR